MKNLVSDFESIFSPLLHSRPQSVFSAWIQERSCHIIPLQKSNLTRKMGCGLSRPKAVQESSAPFTQFLGRAPRKPHNISRQVQYQLSQKVLRLWSFNCLCSAMNLVNQFCKALTKNLRHSHPIVLLCSKLTELLPNFFLELRNLL